MRRVVVIIYMDDLIIPAKDEKESLQNLREILQVASKSRRRKITSSQKTTLAEEKYSSYELEVLAVVNALKKFHTYLLGNHFKIITDCSAFQKTMDKKDLVTRIAKWALLLEEYDYKIVHRSGQRMKHVDALSRYPVTMITSDTLTARLQRAQQEDENIQNLKSLIGTNNATGFFTRNEILHKYVDFLELIAAPRDMQTEQIMLRAFLLGMKYYTNT
ncbi:transposon Tf2-11 polyprotein [Trichonephila clavipes]|nr:transposon Tf2-11 polyprotein [Trichonephila clavipes]